MNRKFNTLIAVLFALMAAGVFALVALGQDGDSQTAGSNIEVANEGVSMLGDGFTYQGHLSDNGSSANGQYDFRFRLFNSNGIVGTQIGDTDEDLNVTVADGLFTVVVSPGPGVFSTGGTRWLEIEVRPATGGDYTTLQPRQEIRPVPQAIYAEFAENLVDVGDTVIQVSPFAAIESDAGSNLTFDAQGNGRLRIVRNNLGNDFVYIPVEVPAQIFGLGQEMTLESMRFCYNGELVGNVVHGGVVRATVRQITNFDMDSMLGESYDPPLTADDSCVVVEAGTPQEVTGSMWVRFEVITGDLAPIEFTEISLTLTSAD